MGMSPMIWRLGSYMSPKENPYLKKKNKHKIGKAGRKSEVRLNKKIGGRQTPASGALETAKGDILKGEFLIEAKATESDTFRLERTILCKIAGEALRVGKLPAVCVSFITGNGKPKVDGEWALIRLKDFKEYMEYREGLEDIE